MVRLGGRTHKKLDRSIVVQAMTSHAQVPSWNIMVLSHQHGSEDAFSPTITCICRNKVVLDREGESGNAGC